MTNGIPLMRLPRVKFSNLSKNKELIKVPIEPYNFANKLKSTQFKDNNNEGFIIILNERTEGESIKYTSISTGKAFSSNGTDRKVAAVTYLYNFVQEIISSLEKQQIQTNWHNYAALTGDFLGAAKFFQSKKSSEIKNIITKYGLQGDVEKYVEKIVKDAFNNVSLDRMEIYQYCLLSCFNMSEQAILSSIISLTNNLGIEITNYASNMIAKQLGNGPDGLSIMLKNKLENTEQINNAKLRLYTDFINVGYKAANVGFAFTRGRISGPNATGSSGLTGDLNLNFIQFFSNLDNKLDLELGIEKFAFETMVGQIEGLEESTAETTQMDFFSVNITSEKDFGEILVGSTPENSIFTVLPGFGLYEAMSSFTSNNKYINNDLLIKYNLVVTNSFMNIDDSNGATIGAYLVSENGNIYSDFSEIKNIVVANAVKLILEQENIDTFSNETLKYVKYKDAIKYFKKARAFNTVNFLSYIELFLSKRYYYSNSREERIFDIKGCFLDGESLFQLILLGLSLLRVTMNYVEEDWWFLKDLEKITSKSDVNSYGVSAGAAMAISKAKTTLIAFENTSGEFISIERICDNVISTVKSKNLEIVKGDPSHIIGTITNVLVTLDPTVLIDSGGVVDIDVTTTSLEKAVRKSLYKEDTGAITSLIAGTVKSIVLKGIANSNFTFSESMEKTMSITASVYNIAGLITYNSFYENSSIGGSKDLNSYIEGLSLYSDCERQLPIFKNNGIIYSTQQDLLHIGMGISISYLEEISTLVLKQYGIML